MIWRRSSLRSAIPSCQPYHATAVKAVKALFLLCVRVILKPHHGEIPMFKKILLAIATLIATMGFAFAQVDVNKADQAALDSVKGIGPVTSKAIVDERAKGGAFKDWADFESRVKGIGPKSSVKLSEAGLQVNGQAKSGAPAAPAAKAAPAKKEAAVKEVAAKEAAPKPAAATDTAAAPAKTAAETKKEAAAAKKEAKAAAAAAKKEAAAAKAVPAAAPAAAADAAPVKTAAETKKEAAAAKKAATAAKKEAKAAEAAAKKEAKLAAADAKKAEAEKK
ncbi:ComEA family DNA-binding protein [Janthinobacterium violaceinigrum]|nr:helix-hairpin-helix domain-containing protein [Janthinobacterium violaceinigrum]